MPFASDSRSYGCGSLLFLDLNTTMQYIILSIIWFIFGYYTNHLIIKRRERAFRDELYSKILENIAASDFMTYQVDIIDIESEK